MTLRRMLAILATLVAAGAVASLAVSPGQASERIPGPAIAPALVAAAPVPSTTTTTVPLPPLPELPPGGFGIGAGGPAVEAFEARLSALHYAPGPADGRFDSRTLLALWAFEKVAALPVSGRVDDAVWAALRLAPRPAPLLPDGGADRVEIDLVHQVLVVYQDDQPALISHMSSGSGRRFCAKGGCGVAITPGGAHRIMWRVHGWRKSRLGRLYNPVYFDGSGVAVHGFSSVPLQPASHGCVRVPMHVADIFPGLVVHDEPVYVFDGHTPVQPLGPAGSGTSPGTPPGTPLPGPPVPHLDGDPPPLTPSTFDTVLA